jgi:hypothetical protein
LLLLLVVTLLVLGLLLVLLLLSSLLLVLLLLVVGRGSSSVIIKTTDGDLDDGSSVVTLRVLGGNMGLGLIRGGLITRALNLIVRVDNLTSRANSSDGVTLVDCSERLGLLLGGLCFLGKK